MQLNFPNRDRGFTLIELMIVIAIITIVASVGLPAYRSYVDTAQMSKVNAAYESAVRMTQQEFKKDTTRISLGLLSTLPTNEAEWVNLFDRTGQGMAPGGGPLYLTGKPAKTKKGQTPAPTTGAVYVKYDTKKGKNIVEIRRPAYIALIPYRAKISRDSIDFKKE